MPDQSVFFEIYKNYNSKEKVAELKFKPVTGRCVVFRNTHCLNV